MKGIFTNQKFLAVYALWALIHVFLYLTSDKSRSGFWPFSGDELDLYDASELFIYLIGPVVVIMLITAFKEEPKRVK